MTIMQTIYKLLIMAPIFFTLICGIILFIFNENKNSKARNIFVCIALAINVLLTVGSYFARGQRFVLLSFFESISLEFFCDEMTVIYTCILAVMWLLVGIYSFGYLEEDERKGKFYPFYFLTLFAMTGVGYAANLITFYMFYEFMTLMSVPLVLHTMTKEAVFAAKKYLFYSIAGASFALFGGAIVFTASKGNISFIAGGIENLSNVDPKLLLLGAFFMILGFGTKAGMFPMHGWLTSAHPVAPAPASAVLSGVIVKTGVLGMIRVIFYLIGPSVIRGTWVQYAFMTCSLITVFMGSMLAFHEKILKKRLAYSTISQVSYICFGLSTLSPIAFCGAILHMIFHSIMKCGLFMNAGAIIHCTGKDKVNELDGIGKKMKLTMITFTCFSLGLVGIPPFCGFMSKWFLCIGAMDAGVGKFGIVGASTLVVSALLTAGYLFTIVVSSFFKKIDEEVQDQTPINEACKKMLVPMIILSVACLILGVYSKPLIDFIMEISGLIMI